MRKAKSKLSCTVFVSQYCYATDETHCLAAGRTLPSPVRMEPNLSLRYRFFLHYTSKVFLHGQVGT